MSNTNSELWKDFYEWEKKLAKNIEKFKSDFLKNNEDEIKQKKEKISKLQEEILSLRKESENASLTSFTELLKHKKKFEPKVKELNDYKNFVSQCPAHIYNPIEVVANKHKAYLRKYLTGPKKLIFIGMNPGVNGMTQTGVPFGNISTVEGMKLDDYLEKLSENDLNTCSKEEKSEEELEEESEEESEEELEEESEEELDKKEELSGKRLWSCFYKLSNNNYDTFFQQCFVYNFGPLTFFDEDFKPITQKNLKKDFATYVKKQCLKTTKKIIKELKPECIVTIGKDVKEWLKIKNVKIDSIPHPAARGYDDQKWCEEVHEILKKNDLIKYFKAEA